MAVLHTGRLVQCCFCSFSYYSREVSTQKPSVNTHLSIKQRSTHTHTHARTSTTDCCYSPLTLTLPLVGVVVEAGPAPTEVASVKVDAVQATSGAEALPRRRALVDVSFALRALESWQTGTGVWCAAESAIFAWFVADGCRGNNRSGASHT